jgi:hypothetical protein
MDELEQQLAATLRKMDATLADDSFSERVLHALPRRRFTGARARRWTLAMAATAGALGTALFAEPLERMLDMVVPGEGVQAAMLVAGVGLLLAIPTLWSLWSARD